MALRPAEHFTEFNLAMWSLSFSHVTVNRFEQINKVLTLLCTGRIDCKYKYKMSKENAVLIKIITLYLNIWTQKTPANRLM